MLLDSLIAFVPLGGNLSIVAAAGVDTASNVVDILGSGQGTPPANIIGTATLFGSDVGIGGVRPELNVVVGTAFTTGTAATLNVALQAAPDAGTPTYLPGTWQTLAETGELTAAQLTANQIIARFPFLPVFPKTLRPRFLRLLFQVPAGVLFTAGTISSAIPTMSRDDQANNQTPKNFTVA